MPTRAAIAAIPFFMRLNMVFLSVAWLVKRKRK